MTVSFLLTNIIHIYIYIYIYVCVCVYTYIRHTHIGGVRGVIFTIIGNGHADLSSNPETVGILFSNNTLGKGMHPAILPPIMGK